MFVDRPSYLLERLLLTQRALGSLLCRKCVVAAFARSGFAVLAIVFLVGCGPRDLLLGTGAAIGSASMQQRGLGGAISDYELKLRINEAWFHHSIEMYQRADFMISGGRVLLYGRVAREAHRTEAEALVRQAGAREVINRLQVASPTDVSTDIKDSSITARLTASLTFDRDVAALNYDIATVAGVVYLMGSGRSEGELRRVLFLARAIPGVVAVESHVVVPEPGSNL